MIFIPYTETDFEKATSYLSVAEADDLMQSQTKSTTWGGFSEDVKKILLNQASLAVDNSVTFQGVKISKAQLLKFPRMEVGDNPKTASKVLPTALKFAVITMSVQTSNSSAFKNVTSETIGKLSVTYAQSASKEDVGTDVLGFLKSLRASTIRVVR